LEEIDKLNENQRKHLSENTITSIRMFKSMRNMQKEMKIKCRECEEIEKILYGR